MAIHISFILIVLTSTFTSVYASDCASVWDGKNPGMMMMSDYYDDKPTLRKIDPVKGTWDETDICYAKFFRSHGVWSLWRNQRQSNWDDRDGWVGLSSEDGCLKADRLDWGDDNAHYHYRGDGRRVSVTSPEFGCIPKRASATKMQGFVSLGRYRRMADCAAAAFKQYKNFDAIQRGAWDSEKDDSTGECLVLWGDSFDEKEHNDKVGPAFCRIGINKLPGVLETDSLTYLSNEVDLTKCAKEAIIKQPSAKAVMIDDGKCKYTSNVRGFDSRKDGTWAHLPPRKQSIPDGYPEAMMFTVEGEIDAMFRTTGRTQFGRPVFVSIRPDGAPYTSGDKHYFLVSFFPGENVWVVRDHDTADITKRLYNIKNIINQTSLNIENGAIMHHKDTGNPLGKVHKVNFKREGFSCYPRKMNMDGGLRKYIGDYMSVAECAEKAFEMYTNILGVSIQPKTHPMHIVRCDAYFNTQRQTPSNSSIGTQTSCQLEAVQKVNGVPLPKTKWQTIGYSTNMISCMRKLNNKPNAKAAFLMSGYCFATDVIEGIEANDNAVISYMPIRGTTTPATTTPTTTTPTTTTPTTTTPSPTTTTPIPTTTTPSPTTTTPIPTTTTPSPTTTKKPVTTTTVDPDIPGINPTEKPTSPTKKERVIMLRIRQNA